MRSTLLLMAVLTLVPRLDGQGSTAPRRCQLVITEVGNELYRQELFATNVNWYGGGGVRMRCRAQEIFLQSDSVVATNGEVIQFIDRARYRDADVTIDADTLVYTKFSELLQATGHVRIVSQRDGAVLVAPRVDHFRASVGLRDTAETTAGIIGRATATLPVTAGPEDSVPPAPYVVNAGVLRRTGGTTRAWDQVTIDRDSLSGRGDTLVYLSGGVAQATLHGTPAVMTRSGADSFTVTGETIILDLLEEELTGITAEGEGHVLGGAGDVRGESVQLAFEDGMLTGTDAWGRGDGARLLAEGYDVRGDSISIETPGERLSQLRVFGQGVMIERLDSTAQAADSIPTDSLPPIQNTIAGNTLVASFADIDSAGTLLTRLREITAVGNATSLFSRDVIRNGAPSPTINYTRADTIIVQMRGGDSTGVSLVRAYRGSQPVDGVQLERASLRPSTAADSTAARRPEGSEG
jgi:hypothetical protein